MKILVSACLAGKNCRYDGGNMLHQALLDYLKEHEVVYVCPEVLSGMSTPRLPSEIKNQKVINNQNEDCDDFFQRGAQITLAIALLNDCKQAILCDGSPSCGSTQIYDGTFTGKKIAGRGVTAALLKEHGIEVCTWETINS